METTKPEPRGKDGYRMVGSCIHCHHGHLLHDAKGRCVLPDCKCLGFEEVVQSGDGN